MRIVSVIFSVIMATVAVASQVGTCRDPNYTTRATSCKIPKEAKQIRECCQNDGVVFCRKSTCICYLNSEKRQRLAEGSGRNLCPPNQPMESPQNREREVIPQNREREVIPQNREREEIQEHGSNK